MFVFLARYHSGDPIFSAVFFPADFVTLKAFNVQFPHESVQEWGRKGKKNMDDCVGAPKVPN